MLQIPTSAPTGASADSTPSPEDRVSVRDSGTGDARRFTSDDLPRPEGAILGSATGRLNGRPTFDPGPEDLVVAGGIQMRAETAEQMGFLHRGPDGRYAEGPDPSVAPSSTPEEDKADTEGPMTLDSQTEANIGEVLTALDHYHGKGAGQSVFSRYLTSGKLPDEVTEMAQWSGVPVGEIKSAIEQATAELVEQADNAAREEGVQNIEAFRRWAAVHRGPHGVTAVTLAHFWQGNLGPTRELARAYLASNPRDAEGSIEGAKQTRDGRRYITVNMPSGKTIPVSETVARRIGLKIPRRTA